jgi:hypothetical protein
VPVVELQSRCQKVVLWAFIRAGNHGEPIVAAPVELDVNWNDKRHETMDAQNNVVNADASLIVDRDISAESIVWQGAMVDLPEVPTGLMKVVGFNGVRDIRGHETFRSVSLVRFGDKLPAVEST